MAYEAPRLTEAGKFSSTTLGNELFADNRDANSWFWGTDGSR